MMRQLTLECGGLPPLLPSEVGAGVGWGSRLGVQTPIAKGKTVWLEPVTDKDYNSAK